VDKLKQKISQSENRESSADELVDEPREPTLVGARSDMMQPQDKITHADDREQPKHLASS
jgi:hypothetical protein